MTKLVTFEEISSQFWPHKTIFGTIMTKIKNKIFDPKIYFVIYKIELLTQFLSLTHQICYTFQAHSKFIFFIIITSIFNFFNLGLTFFILFTSIVRHIRPHLQFCPGFDILHMSYGVINL